MTTLTPLPKKFGQNDDSAPLPENQTGSVKMTTLTPLPKKFGQNDDSDPVINPVIQKIGSKYPL